MRGEEWRSSCTAPISAHYSIQQCPGCYGMSWSQYHSLRYCAPAQSRFTDIHWHRQVISAAAVAQTVRFCVFLIGQKLLVCGESAVTRMSSQIWHLNGASKRNMETPQPSQSTHSNSEIYSGNFHLLMFTNRSRLLEYVFHLKLLSKYVLGLIFNASWAVQFRCSVLKIQTVLAEQIDSTVWAHLMTGWIFRCKDSHLHICLL